MERHKQSDEKIRTNTEKNCISLFIFSTERIFHDQKK